MTTRDESHLFSLAALTTRAAAPPPRPSEHRPEPDDHSIHPAAEHTAPWGTGWPLFPLGAPLGSVAEPLTPTAASAARRGHTLAFVVAGLALGGGIVTLAAVWSGESAGAGAGQPSARLAPETVTETLVPPPAPELRLFKAPAVAAPPEALATPPEPAGSGAPTTKSVPRGPQAPRTIQRPRSAVPRDQSAKPQAPTRAPLRGACAHCAAQDLACNIKCRAGG